MTVTTNVSDSSCYWVPAKEPHEIRREFWSLSSTNMSGIHYVPGARLASCKIATASKRLTQLTWSLKDFYRQNWVCRTTVCVADIVAVFVLASSSGGSGSRGVSSELWEGPGPDGCPIQPNDSIPWFPPDPPTHPPRPRWRPLQRPQTPESEREGVRSR